MALERRAMIDPLTEIANRTAFEERLSAVVDDARRSQRGVGLIMVDLDHFKRLNDAYGYPAGDEALRRVGRPLKRISDGPQLAARYGGEEFAVIVVGATARALRELAEDIRKNIEKLGFEYDGQLLSLTASLGAAHVSYEWEMPSTEDIFGRADGCLYDAKRSGRNRVEITFWPARPVESRLVRSFPLTLMPTVTRRHRPHHGADIAEKPLHIGGPAAV